MFTPHVLTAGATIFVWSLLIHAFVDWFLQSNWQAQNKSSLKHPASWIHSGLHFVFMLIVFPWYLAAFVAVTHLVIDIRKPLVWWRKMARQCQMENPEIYSRNDMNAMHVAFWQDQMAHWIILGLVSLF